jgi:flagellar biosynthesis protein
MIQKNKPELQKTAVALHFDGVNAPMVSAKGTGLTGEAIIQLAKDHGVPLHEDSNLAKSLSCIPIGEEIPVEVFEIVAEVLAYIYFLDDAQSGEQAL